MISRAVFAKPVAQLTWPAGALHPPAAAGSGDSPASAVIKTCGVPVSFGSDATAVALAVGRTAVTGGVSLGRISVGEGAGSGTGVAVGREAKVRSSRMGPP